MIRPDFGFIILWHLTYRNHGKYSFGFPTGNIFSEFLMHVPLPVGFNAVLQILHVGSSSATDRSFIETAQCSTSGVSATPAPVLLSVSFSWISVELFGVLAQYQLRGHPFRTFCTPRTCSSVFTFTFGVIFCYQDMDVFIFDVFCLTYKCQTVLSL